MSQQNAPDNYPRRNIVKQFAMRFVRDEQGQDLIEYGLLIGIITVAAIAAILAIGPKLTNYFSTLNTNLP